MAKGNNGVRRGPDLRPRKVQVRTRGELCNRGHQRQMYGGRWTCRQCRIDAACIDSKTAKARARQRAYRATLDKATVDEYMLNWRREKALEGIETGPWREIRAALFEWKRHIQLASRVGRKAVQQQGEVV